MGTGLVTEEKSKSNDWRTLQFKKGFISLIISFVFYIISFASPYWLQVYHNVPYDFKNMGLWEVCLDNYYFRQDTRPRPFTGCQWLFNIDIMLFQDVFDTPYVIWCQVFSIFALLFLLAAVIIALLIFIRSVGQSNYSYWILSTVLTLLTGLTGIFVFVMVMIFGIKSGDRTWMPRADLVWLSWAYAFAVISTFFSVVCAYFFGQDMRHYWGSPAPDPGMFAMPLFRTGDAAMEPPDTGSVFAN